jgi:hypothetical protein
MYQNAVIDPSGFLFMLFAGLLCSYAHTFSMLGQAIRLKQSEAEVANDQESLAN